jgi:hypothetical protein
MAMPCPPMLSVPAVRVQSRQLRFANKASEIPEVASAALPVLQCAAKWPAPGRMTRQLRERKFPIEVKDKDLYSFGKVHSLIRKYKPMIKPVYEERLTLSSESRKRWVLEGINFPASMTKLIESAKKYSIRVPRALYRTYLKASQPLQWKVRSVRARVPRCDAGATCTALLATGKCDRYHPRPEVQYAKGGLAEKGAYVKSAASAFFWKAYLSIKQPITAHGPICCVGTRGCGGT